MSGVRAYSYTTSLVIRESAVPLVYRAMTCMDGALTWAVTFIPA